MVNFIRNRAGLGNLKPDLAKEDFRKEIFKERTFEMASKEITCTTYAVGTASPQMWKKLPGYRKTKSLSIRYPKQKLI